MRGALRRGSAAIALAAALGATALAPSTPAATTVTVTSPNDSGPGTLRALLATAGPGDTILVPGTYHITLATQLEVTTAAPGVTISSTGGGMATLDGNHATRIIHVNASSGLAVNGLRFTGGRVAGPGAAIQSFTPSTLAVNDSVFTDNGTTGGNRGGAIQVNGDVPLAISGSTFTGNFTDSNGGGIEIDTPNTAAITKSVISGNQATGASGNGGGIHMNGDVTLNLSDSTVAGNTAGASGGGIKVFSPGTLNMVNTTVAGNGAAGNGGGISYNSSTGGTLLNSTIAQNQATGGTSRGGGLEIPGSTSNNVQLKNTIVAGNTAANGANCGGFSGSGPQFTSAGHNLENGTSCAFAAAGDLNADPLLGQLADNGGTTQTMALLPGSPAIDSGENNGCPGSDQRGQVRPVDGGSGHLICDIGAFEKAPSNDFQIGPRAKCKPKRTCKAFLVTLTLPGQGSLTAADGRVPRQASASAARKPFIKPASTASTGPATFKLRLKLTRTAQKKLLRKRKLKVPVRFAFTPTGGATNQKAKTFRLKLPRKRR